LQGCGGLLRVLQSKKRAPAIKEVTTIVTEEEVTLFPTNAYGGRGGSFFQQIYEAETNSEPRAGGRFRWILSTCLAAAVGAIAFGLPVVPVDGNVERVMSRVWAIDTPLPQARPLIRARAAALMEQEAACCAPSDTAQALFDLGATLCTPTTPACALCPWAETCEGRRQGIAAALPRKAPKAVRPRRHGAHFYLADEEGRVLLRRRPAKGLLGGMVEIPGTAWRADPWTLDEALAQAPVLQAGWVRRGTVRHVFTHFELLIDVYAAHVASVPTGAIETGYLCAPGDLATQALPSLMAKCLTLGQNTRAEAAPAADYSADLLV